MKKNERSLDAAKRNQGTSKLIDGSLDYASLHQGYVLFACLLIFLIPSTPFASGFSLYNEINGVAVGNYAAGIAAEFSDASTGYSNPAGLSFLHHDQGVFGAVGVIPYASLSGNTLYTTQLPIPDSPPYFYTETFHNLTTGPKAAVPSFHFAHPLGPNTSFGLSVVSPYGLSTEWDITSPLRYEATYTKLLTVDISPEIGGRLSDNLSAGVGLDFQQAYVTFNQMLGSPALLSDFDPSLTTVLDSESVNKGDSFGLGFHAGLLAHFNEQHSRIGVNFQSAVSHAFNGTSRLTGRLADPTLNIFDPLVSNPQAVFINDQLYSNTISLPSVTTLSVYQDIHPRVALLGSIVYTGWSSFQAIQLFNIAAVAVDESGQATHANTNVTTLENYRDTWRYALGANVQLTQKLMLRMGTGYEQTPTINAERDVRLPDANRVAVSMGGHYQLNRIVGFDAGYSHYFLDTLFVDKTNPLQINQFQVQATGNAHANLVGAQLVLTLD
jgi:long-chain fatty acid transport protein